MDGDFAVISEVEGALVDVHSDEAIGHVGVEIAGELHGVGERFVAVIEGVLDAVAECVGGGEEGLGPEGTTDGITAEWQGQAGLLVPPLAEVEEFDEAIVGVGELALVDDEAGVELSGDDGGDDLVEGDELGFDVGGEEFEGEVGGGEGAGDSDAGLFDLVEGHLAGGDDHGSVAIADAAAAGHDGVVVLEVGIGVEGDGGDIVEGFVDGFLVEGFDVGEGVGELESGHAHLAGGQTVEHKCVVGVGAVGDADLLNCGAGGVHFEKVLNLVVTMGCVAVQ